MRAIDRVSSIIRSVVCSYTQLREAVPARRARAEVGTARGEQGSRTRDEDLMAKRTAADDGPEHSGGCLTPPATEPEPLRVWCAPMVLGSELAFRMLV